MNAEERSQPCAALSVAELLAGAGRALAVSGPGECWVTGTLSGWRTSKAYGWGELVQHSADGRNQVARVPIGMPWSVLQRARRALARSGVELADGLEVRVFGALEIGGRYAPFRLVVSALDHRTSVGSVVVARSPRSARAGREHGSEPGRDPWTSAIAYRPGGTGQRGCRPWGLLRAPAVLGTPLAGA